MTSKQSQKNSSRTLAPVPGVPDSASKAGWRSAKVHKSLLRALAAKGLSHQAESAFSWWPTLLNTAVALCAHVGEEIQSESGESLAHLTVGEAVKAFNQATNESGRIEEGVTAFLKAVVDVADELMQVVVFVEDENGKRHCWRQFNEAFDDWRRDQDPVPEVKIRPAPYVFGDELWAARRMLATITMTPSDFGRLFSDMAFR